MTRGNAQEASYFDEKDREALQSIRETRHLKPRMSPITGEPLERLNIHGVEVHHCKESGGVWITREHFQLLTKKLEPEAPKRERNWLTNLIHTISEPH